MSSQSLNIQDDLSKRHKSVSTTIIGLVIAAILLSVVAFVGRNHFNQQPNGVLEMTLMIIVLFLGLGAIVWRRTKFASMRLQDIGGLEGPTGLLRTLEKTTLQVAIAGAAAAVIGFIATLATGNEARTYQGTAVALVVLLYSYPTKSSWTRVIGYFAKDSESNPS